MAKMNAALYAFNRGLISRLGLARTDLDRVRLSAEQQTNWMPRTLGSMTLRPGLEYIGSTNGDAKARHIPFVFATDDVALIEITGSTMRVRVDDSVVTRASVSTSVTNGTFDSNLNDWTDGDETGATSQWATGGYMSLAGTDYDAAIREQEVTVAGGDQGTKHALKIVVERGNVTLRVGSTSGDDDYISEAVLGTGEHSLAFTPTGNFHIWLANRTQYAALVDSVAVEASGDMEVTVPWGADDLSLLRWEQSADVIYVACDGYQPRKIERRGIESWSVVLYEPQDGPFRVINTSTLRLTPSAISGDITLTASRAFFRSDHVGAMFRLSSAGQKVESDITGENQWSNTIRVTGVGNGRRFTIARSGTWSGTVRVQRSIGEEGSWVNILSYSSNGSTTYTDNLDNQVVFYRIGMDTGDYSSGTATVELEYAVGSITGVARVTGYTSDTQVDAAVLIPLGGTDATEDWSESVWSDRRGWPTVPRFYEGRLWWAGRNWIIGSVPDGYESFDEDIEGDSAPIIRTIGTGPVDVINWMIAASRLLVGTQGSELSIRSSSFDEPLTPTNFNIKDASTQGSGAVGAVKVDKRGYYVQRGGVRIFEAVYELEANDYISLDRTLVVPEIGEPSVDLLAVQRQPDTRIHALRSDGTVAVLISDPVENVAAWVEVETDGVVEDIATLPGTTEDAVYYTVKRTIDGNTKRYLEKWALESEATVFSTIYSGSSTTSITDLDYTDDTEVTVRDANGDKVENLTVTDGAITLSTAASYAHITPSFCRLADSFLIYDGSATSTITGLSHLEGESVVVWADGKCLTDSNGAIATFTVSGGQISLTDGGSSVSVETAVVGLGYRGRFKSSKLAYAAQGGTALTQKKKVERIGLILADTHAKGLTFGQDFDHMNAMPEIENGKTVEPHTVRKAYDAPGIPIPGAWDTDSRLCLEANAPRPVTALAAVITVQTNEQV